MSGNKKQFQQLGIYLQTLITDVLTPIVSAIELTFGYTVTMPGDLRQRIATLSGFIKLFHDDQKCPLIDAAVPIVKSPK